MFGVAGVGACLLQVIHADKCVLPGNSHQENQEWPAKVLGLASYGQDKLVESAQLCANAGNTSIECSAVVHVILQEIRVCGHQKAKFSLARAETALAKSSFQQGGARKKVGFTK